MIGLMFTLDYEVYGNGEGDIISLVLEPTRRFLEISDEYDAKITIFAEVAEFLAMKKVDKYKESIRKVEEQLQNAVRHGHDVQLHLHPQWFGAKYHERRWDLNYNCYSIAKLPLEKSVEFLNIGKTYLENLLRDINPNYRCCAFRAGNWCMMPSENILNALKIVGIESDSSVFKWGEEYSKYIYYDYSTAHSNFLSWFAQPDNINNISSDKSNILEIPIYTEKVLISSMVTKKRLLLKKMFPKIPNNLNVKNENRLNKILNLFFRYHPKKFDFCKLTFSEMKKMINNIVKYDQESCMVPISTIGHSKEFYYDEDYKNILKYINNRYNKIILIDSYSSILTRYKNSLSGTYKVKTKDTL